MGNEQKIPYYIQLVSDPGLENTYCIMKLLMINYYYVNKRSKQLSIYHLRQHVSTFKRSSSG